jgi:hypothetical protein
MVRSIATASIISMFLTASPLRAQPPTSFVNKLGIDQDVRSGTRILIDDLASGPVLLPDDTALSTTLDVVPEVKLRGSNVQANAPSGDYIQQFPRFCTSARQVRD